MKKDTAVKVTNLSKNFKLPHEKQNSLKGAFLSSFKKKSYETQEALRDIDFEVKKGEFFGVVGRNGSGKSTLLKCIAGVYTPTEGSVEIDGVMVPFIELGVGFNPELTGRDNVYLNGALLGFSREEMTEMYDEIVEFAELGNFMDQKLKNYSSGMQVRLAFSIAIRAKADVLILDEVLAVGDTAFQQKCNDYFSGLKKDNQTIILVSHNMSAVERYCDRALLLENSEVMGIGPSEDIADLYEDMMLKEEAEKRADKVDSLKRYDSSTQIEITALQDGKPSRSIEAFSDLKLEIALTSNKDLKDNFFGVNIRNSEKNVVFAMNSEKEVGAFNLKKGEKTRFELEIDNLFTNGTYYVSFTLTRSIEGVKKVVYKNRSEASFTIYGVRNNADSIVHPKFNLSRILEK